MAPERKFLPGKKGWSKHEIPLPPDLSPPSTPGSDDDVQDEMSEVSLTEVITPEELAAINAKVELMKARDGDGISLYHHLSELLTEVLTSWTPEEAASSLEEISRQMKRERMKSFVQVLKADEPAYGVTRAEWELFKTIGHEIPDVNPKREFPPTNDSKGQHKTSSRNFNSTGDSENNQSGATKVSLEQTDEDKSDSKGTDQKLRLLPDLMRQCHVFNMAGFGLSSTEYTKLALAMRELVMAWPITSIRFWGKIFGTHDNYYVVETQMIEEEYDDEDDENDDGGDDNVKNNNAENVNGLLDDEHSLFAGDSDDGSDIVHTTYKPPPVIPIEEPGTGVNAFVYFVCSQPGLPWHRLAYVTPQQIVVARQITSLFTGDLNHVHASYPPFPGNEAGYLRAQIARITSSTSISPIGCFKFDEEAEDEEEHAEAIRESCVLDEEFDGVPMRDLGDSSLQYWAHHVNYILPQGRTTWFNPLNAPTGGDEGEEDEEGEEERNDPDEFEPEIPQPLLAPISEDVAVGPSPPWIARVTSQFVPEHSPVAVTSVRWPGAVTVATDRGKFYANLYIGWGLKTLDDNFDPAIPPEPEMEFPTGPEVIEQEDPTPEEEAAMRAVMKEQEDLMDDENEEEEEEEEEEGENEEIYE